MAVCTPRTPDWIECNSSIDPAPKIPYCSYHIILNSFLMSSFSLPCEPLTFSLLLPRIRTIIVF